MTDKREIDLTTEADEATESGPPSKRVRTDASPGLASPAGAAAITGTPLSDFAPAVGMAWAPHAGELLVGTPTGGVSGGAAGSGKLAAGASAASGAGANAGAKGDLAALGALLAGHLRGPLLLLLSGPPGPGKSTFCKELLRCCAAAGDPVLTGWTVVCQDTAGAGGIKPGKREKVEKAAKAALARGQSVVVDRTKLNATQCAHFTAIGRGLAVPVHVLVFSTPHAKCAQRVKQRVGHPGGVEGDRGVGVFKRFGKLSPPSLAEQIDTIVSCADEAQVSAAARMYACGVVRAEAAGPSKRAQAHGSGTIDAAPAGHPPLSTA